MKSIALIASNILIPISIIGPVASTLSSYKNNLNAYDAETKSTFLSTSGTQLCNDLKKIYPNWHDWCMKKQNIASGNSDRS